MTVNRGIRRICTINFYFSAPQTFANLCESRNKSSLLCEEILPTYEKKNQKIELLKIVCRASN